METKKVKVRVRSAVLKTFWYSKYYDDKDDEDDD